MAKAYLQPVAGHTEPAALLVVDKPSDEYTALTTPPGDGAHRDVPETPMVQWEEVSFGGGSAFAHLTEDADAEGIVADWSIFVGDPTFAETVTEIDLGGVSIWSSSAIGHNFSMGVVGDAQYRFNIAGDGTLSWGNGAVPTGDAWLKRVGGQELAFGGDGGYVSVEVYANGADPSGGETYIDGTSVQVSNGAIFMELDPGYLTGAEIADPAAPSANHGRLYFKDVGGKTALVARFPTGAVQQIAIEP